MHFLRTIPQLLRILSSYKRRSDVVGAMPIRLWVETSARCNLRCEMCVNRDFPDEKKCVMDMGLFTKIVDESKHFANDMYLHHRGEPFLNPKLPDMITYARNAGLRTRFHTNGTLLNESRTQALLEAGPDLVSFSVDGFDKESYEKIRVGAHFEKTVENIIHLTQARDRAAMSKPYVVVERIRFQNPDPPEDERAIADLKTRFLEAGVNEVITKEEYVWTTEDSPQIDGGRTCSCCTFPWYAMVICADGTVTPCPQDFMGAMAMGNVSQTALKDIWNGEAYRSLRNAFRKDVDSLQLCRKCDRLRRKTVGGVPFQYMITFLVDQLVGYGALRRIMGTSER